MRLPTTGKVPTNGGRGGHHLLCWKCGLFQIHTSVLDTSMEGEAAIKITCSKCGESDRFVFRAGMWTHDKIAFALDKWAKKVAKETTMPKSELSEEEPVKQRRFGLWHKEKRGKEKPEEEEERDEFEGMDLLSIHTFGDASKVFPDDFDKAVRLLERANRAYRAVRLLERANRMRNK